MKNASDIFVCVLASSALLFFVVAALKMYGVGSTEALFVTYLVASIGAGAACAVIVSNKS